MAILTWGGLPLLVDGKLTVDPNCCCLEVPPPPCPPCCVRIDWGTFDAAGNLEASYSAGGYTIEMVVELPTPGSRIVCDGQRVVVKWEIIGAPDPGNNNAWVRFGPAWKRIANSPAVESGAGKIYERGLIEFGNQESRTYEGTLELDSCFLDSSVTTWGISVGMDNPSWSQEVEIGRCFKTQFCCTVNQDCLDCCFLYASSETGWVYTEGKFCKIVQAGGYTLVICAESTRPGIVCLPEDGISISVSIIPPRHVTTELFNLKIEWQANWTLGVYSPALGVGGIENDDSPGHVDWGDSIATDYEIDLVSGCSPCDGPEQLDAFGEIAITLNSTELAAPIEDGITFDPCGDQSDCCCPPVCKCGCVWPLSENFCETALEDAVLGKYELGPVKIENLKITIVADDNVFCNFSQNTAEITQVGDSWHLGTCEAGREHCPVSEELRVPVYSTENHCGEPAPTAPDFHVLIRPPAEAAGCEPNIVIDMTDTMGGSRPILGPGVVPLSSGGLSNCSQINGSGSLTTDGVTYNWTVTGTIQGLENCPCEESE